MVNILISLIQYNIRYNYPYLQYKLRYMTSNNVRLEIFLTNMIIFYGLAVIITFQVFGNPLIHLIEFGNKMYI